ncbi:acyltransferase family protein [Corynebacterium cystitidis]|uniref:Peptidoglycan/LPS O-acetylase OafA/YrhL, contains acyltransferase and SGNH-hydrolase domains n=1 Tax=Corynebacterium cystitidis DSM 20524 TaxID=1121357 RepID=A0A1H9NWT6_9CORY|nr:acyltransferase family protein [Corynebacterium cystitidis]WJY82704.1 O-acetyltransferase OatA [Corynebacterium cystitidis DSM 20524]SER40257.1 Peptidoglycan/LPS O-acetylase OafA/YrhL, contains acyltransferase and SGNH-hydrolase domains [Corynebacterium cystitidis DSM 20524]SNV71591.1 lipopolysaccharide biosynthesis acyltransferase, m [Corynebacterium cystitidis]
MTSAQRKPTYRHDLDGLRGYAIALVVLFHVYVGRVSGGVDVFLLLSGFFFLGSQLRYALRRHASLNPWWPIWRTARRLLPALAVTLIATVIAVLTLAPELLTPELTQQFTAAAFYYLNWQLMAQDAAYSAASVDTSPLQHLWSMSVQGQFYLLGIVFALGVAWWIRRFHTPPEIVRRTVVIILLVATLLSFAWASRHGLIGTADNYYSTFSRMWEMTLGGLLAIVAHRLTIPSKFAAWTAGLGVVMITITGIVVPTSLAFPGPVALLPLVGAVLVITSAGDHPISRVLSSRPATWLGRIAYSLYLWHWPMLIITTAMTGHETPPVWLGTLVVAASLLLAHVTHRWVEEPLKQHRKRPTLVEKPIRDAQLSLKLPTGRKRAAGGVVVAALMGAIVAVQPVWDSVTEDASKRLDPARYPGVMAQFGADIPDVKPKPDPTLIAGMYPPIGGDGCMIGMHDSADEFRGDECIYGNPDAEATVVLVGGSHAEPYGIPLDSLGWQHNFRVIPFVRQQCPIMLGDDTGVLPECAAWSENAFQRIVELDPDLVVSTSTRPEGEFGHGPDFVPAGYIGFWQALDEHAIPFLGLRDNPWFFDAEKLPEDPNHCLIRTKDERVCSMHRDDVYAPVDPAQEIVADLNHVTAIDTADWFCTADYCSPIIGNIYVYRDTNHISNQFAASTEEVLWNGMQYAVQ